MGRITYGAPDNPLNTALTRLDLGHAGGITTLAELPTLITELAPLWWNHINAEHGVLTLKAGPARTSRALLPGGLDLFTFAARLGAQALTNCLDRDASRRAKYGPRHADLLTVRFEFTEHYPPTTDDHDFADGVRRTIPQQTAIAGLHLDETPVWCAPVYFGLNGGRYDDATRTTTVDPAYQAHAVRLGWHKALTEAGAVHIGHDPDSGVALTHSGPYTACEQPGCR